jgi:hypothetical protein
MAPPLLVDLLLCPPFGNLSAQSNQQFALPGLVADLALLRFTILQFTPRRPLYIDRGKDEAQTFKRFRQTVSHFETEISPALGHTATHSLDKPDV